MALGKWNVKNDATAAEPQAAGKDGAERCLSLLVDGVVRQMPEIHAEGYQDLRANVERLSLQLRDGLPEDDKVELIRGIAREMETYRAKVDVLLRERLASWRGLASYLVRDRWGAADWIRPRTGR
jgi:hypothetical protein